MVRLLSNLLGSNVTHVLHTARISNDERVLYNDTETQMGRLLSNLLGSYVTHVLRTARISNDDRVLYNDTETLMVRLLSHLPGSYVTDVLHTAWISNDETVLYNDTETIIVTVNIISYLLVSYAWAYGPGGRGGLQPPQSLGNSDFLGSKRKLGQSQFLKTFPCFLLLLLYFEDINIFYFNQKSA